MLNFFRDHSRVITKLYSNQFGAAFFALMLALAASSSQVIFLCTSIFSVLFLLFLNYTVIWEEGAKSRIRVDAGRERYNSKTGLWLGLAAGFPNLLLGVVASVTYFLAAKDGPFQLEWVGNICAVVNAIARFWQAMYLGIIQYIAPGSRYILLAIPLPAILFSWFFYWLGLQNFHLFGIFSLKKPAKPSGSEQKQPEHKKR